MKKTWKIMGLALLLGILVALYPMSSVFASPLTPVDTLSSTSTGVTATHTITFTTATSIPVGGRIEIVFMSGFTGVVSIANGDVTPTLTNSATSTWSGSGQTVTGTITGSNAVTAGAQQIVIGGTDKITNPSAAGTYTINVVTRNASGAQLDSGYCLVQVGMSLAASVTVKTYISATIADNGDPGINFGNMDPGTTSAELAQNATGTPGAITVSIGSETNVGTVYVSTAALNANWSSGSNTFPCNDGTFASVYNPAGTPPGTAMSTSYLPIASASAGGTVQVYHWLKIPDNQAAGLYSNTYLYKVDVS